MADFIQMDGKKYVPLKDAESLMQLDSQRIMSLAKEGKVFLRAVGAKVYVDLEGLKNAMRPAAPRVSVEINKEHANAPDSLKSDVTRKIHTLVKPPITVAPQLRNSVFSKAKPSLKRVPVPAAPSGITMSAAQGVISPEAVTAAKVAPAPHGLELQTPMVSSSIKIDMQAKENSLPMIRTAPVALLNAVNPRAAALAVAAIAIVFIAGGSFASQGVNSRKLMTWASNKGTQAAAVIWSTSGILEDESVDNDSAQVRSSIIALQNAAASTQAQSDVSQITQQPIYYVYNYPVIERVTTELQTIDTADPQDFSAQLNALYQKIQQQIQSLTISTGSQFAQTYSVVSQTNSIDKLGGVTITDSTISGATISGGTVSGVSFSDIAFSSPVAITYGGTGTSSAPTWGQVLLGNSLGGYDLVATSSLGISGTSLFTGLTDTPSSLVTGDIVYASAADTLGRLPAGSTGQVLKISGGVPVWSSDLVGGGGGAGVFATSSDELSIQQVDPTQVLLLGTIATSTTGNILEVVGDVLFRDALTVYGTLSLPRIIATSTSLASTFSLASTSQLSVFTKAYFGGSATTTIDSAGNVAVAGTLAQTGLATLASGFVSQSSSTVVGAFTTTGAITSSASAASTLPYASSTALSVSGTGYLGTLSATNIQGASLSTCESGNFLTWSGGQFGCSADQTTPLGSGITSLNGLTGGTQTFATSSSDANLKLTITSSGTAHTFTPSWEGTLSVARGGTGWGNITAGTILYGNGSGALATSSGLTFNGTTLAAAYASSTALTVSGTTYLNALNLTYASSTRLSVFGSAYFGGTSTTTIDSTGAITVASNSKNTFPYASSTALSVSGQSYFSGSAAFAGITNTGTLSQTGLASFSIASSSQFSIFNRAYFGGTSTTTIDSTGAITVASNSANTFPYASSTALTVSGTAYFSGLGIWDSSGNVGIGTTSPMSLLTLEASGGNTTTLTIANNDSVVNGVDQVVGAIDFFTADGSSGGTGVQAYIRTLHDDPSLNGRSYALTFGTSETTTLSEKMRIDKSGNVGIGTTSPFRKLSVTDAVSTAQAALSYDTTRNTDFLTDSSGDLTIDPSGDDVRINDDNLWVCASGSCPSGTPAGTGNLLVETALGASTSTPAWALTASNASKPQLALTDAGTTNAAWTFRNAGGLLYIATSTYSATSTVSAVTINKNGFFGVGTSSPSQQLSTAGLIFVGGNGAAGMGTATSTFYGDIRIVGKLDVGTIDPVYTISGVKYATYGHSTVGIKEEVAVKVVPEERQLDNDMFVYTIKFDALERGSDLWLFYQVTDFGPAWKSLVVSLTPEFDGRVYYEFDSEYGALHIYASKSAPVSVRLLANRFDFSKWPNLRPDQDDPYTSFIIDEKKPLIF